MRSDKLAAPDLLSDPLLSISQLAEWAGCSTKTVRFEIAMGRMPGPDCKIGRRPKWRTSTIARWLDEQRKGNR